MQHTVLIADDEPSVRLLVQATIEAEGYKVLEACDGDEAWALIQEHRPSLVLLDVRMPGRTGLEILGSIKADAELTDTKVILLTASAQQSDINAGLIAGADFYLTKPFSPRELLSRMDEALLL
ncbi:MAG: response regulator [Chloroflexi bacterium]|nr:MAG: response regulator [Chloroflexota bacterium]TMF36296.1 MAG: response regulator [Chloroflexota bacterium]